VFLTLPPPPCAFPGPDFRPPIEPGVCEYSIEQGVCEFHGEGKHNTYMYYTPSSCNTTLLLISYSHYYNGMYVIIILAASAHKM
jgi:hypothetical protein